jgi:GTP-binding protein
MKILNSKLFITVFEVKNLPVSDFPEYVFAGRSNVGKSTLINSICNAKSLARTSSVPGKTQSINYYLINDKLYFVDLPGYGYAKSSKESKVKWKNLIEIYFNENRKIKYIFLLLDIRHILMEQDKQMLEWLNYIGLNIICVLTKSDKLTRNEINQQKFKLEKEIKNLPFVSKIIPFSAVTRIGIDQLLEVIE